MTSAVRIAELERENAALRRRDGDREREVTALREALEKSLKELEEWKRGFRERGKRRSSRAEGRKASGRRPGRKPGHEGAQREVPKRIDHTVEYPAPSTSLAVASLTG